MDLKKFAFMPTTKFYFDHCYFFIFWYIFSSFFKIIYLSIWLEKLGFFILIHN